MSDQGSEDRSLPGTISEADRAAIKGRSQEIGHRLAKLRETHAPKRPARGNASASGALGDAMKLAIEPVVGIVVGLGIGLMVDNAMGSKPFGLIVGLLVGAAAGMLNLMRAAQKTTRTSSDAPEPAADRRPDGT